MRRAAPLALLALALIAPAAFSATPQTEPRPEPQTTITDVEDEVMCPICGTLLELADSPQARRQKALIAELIAAGRSKEEIKDALVAEYGSEVLAEPEGSGFDASAYLVPTIGFAIAAIALAIGIGRWRRRGGPPTPRRRARGEDDERLDADIARYDL